MPKRRTSDINLPVDPRNVGEWVPPIDEPRPVRNSNYMPYLEGLIQEVLKNNEYANVFGKTYKRPEKSKVKLRSKK